MVEMGVDRMHHGFWKDIDPSTAAMTRTGRTRDAILDYHRHVDSLLAGCSSTPTTTPSSSSSPTTAPSAWTAASGSTSGCGARASSRRMREPNGSASSRTSASTGADGRLGRGRLLLAHLHQRRAAGSRRASSPPEDYERVRDDLAAPSRGDPRRARQADRDEGVQARGGLRARRRASPPDLIVHFGDLLWRSIGTVGGDDGIHTFENDTGPDDANHAQDGLLIMAGPGIEPGAARACTCSTSHRPCSTLLDLRPRRDARQKPSSG